MNTEFETTLLKMCATKDGIIDELRLKLKAADRQIDGLTHQCEMKSQIIAALQERIDRLVRQAKIQQDFIAMLKRVKTGAYNHERSDN